VLAVDTRRGCERVVEGPDGFSSGCRGEKEADSHAPVLDLDPESVIDVSAIPEEARPN
jgi:hypothetical protein